MGSIDECRPTSTIKAGSRGHCSLAGKECLEVDEGEVKEMSRDSLRDRFVIGVWGMAMRLVMSRGRSMINGSTSDTSFTRVVENEHF